MIMTQSALSSYSDSELLSMRVKDLPLMEGPPPHKKALKKLHMRLKSRGINWRPDIWPADEWFSPDGRAGFAYPFTLLDKRLIALEKKIIGHCEGATETEFEKLINHECAHAFDNAFGTREDPRRISLFGDPNAPYPKSYLPMPHSKKFVRHLPGNYAQAHPEEDWAETFAVWLRPKEEWKGRYSNWPAFEKLKVCDIIMRELKGARPKRVGRGRPLHFRKDERTLKEYFHWKRGELGLNRANFYARSAKGVFAKVNGIKAAEVISCHEKRIVYSLTQATGVKTYEAKHMIQELKRECAKMDYSVPRRRKRPLKEVEKLLAANAPKYIKLQRRRIFM